MAPIRRVRHACPHPGCTATFARRYDIKRHLPLHDEDKDAEKIWACPFGCPRPMRQKGNMNTHIENVHGVQLERASRSKGRSPDSTSTSNRAVGTAEIYPARSMQEGLNVFQVTEPEDTRDVSCKVEVAEEQGYLSANDSDLDTFDSLPSLSPSSSVSGSLSSASWEYLPSPGLGYDSNIPAVPLSTPAFDYYAAQSQQIPAPYLNYDFVPSSDVDVACPNLSSTPDLFPTVPVQQDSYAQCWNVPPTTFIPAYGLVNPLLYSQSELQNSASVNLSSTDLSGYTLTNELSYGAYMPEESLEYQQPTVDIPPLYQSNDELSYDDLIIQSINPTGYSDADYSYFDQSWNLPSPLDNFDAFPCI